MNPCMCGIVSQQQRILVCSHWAKGSLGQAYIEKNPLAALQAFAIASGWEQSSFMRRHFLVRALVRRIAKECPALHTYAVTCEQYHDHEPIVTCTVSSNLADSNSSSVKAYLAGHSSS